MSASYDTMIRIHNVLLKYVDSRKLDAMLRDLLEIPGNRSFRESIQRLAEIREKINEDRSLR